MENSPSIVSSPRFNARFWLIFTAIICLSGIIIVSILRDRLVRDNQWQVSVVGRGRVQYEPDTARVYLGVSVDKVDKPEKALTQLNSTMDKIIASLKKMGLEDKDITTDNYSLEPQYDYVDNVSRLGGYSARQTVIVKLTGIVSSGEKVSSVISAATAAGANRVNQIIFESSDFDALKQTARLKAIADARSKAGAISSELGVRLGKVVGWWENYLYPSESVSYYGDLGKGGGGAPADPNIPVGSREIVMEVSVNYEIR